MKFRTLLMTMAFMGAVYGCCDTSTPPAQNYGTPAITTGNTTSGFSNVTTSTAPNGTVIKETTTATMYNGRTIRKDVATEYTYPNDTQ